MARLSKWTRLVLPAATLIVAGGFASVQLVSGETDAAAGLRDRPDVAIKAADPGPLTVSEARQVGDGNPVVVVLDEGGQAVYVNDPRMQITTVVRGYAVPTLSNEGPQQARLARAD